MGQYRSSIHFFSETNISRHYFGLKLSFMSQYCRFKFLSMVCCLTLQCSIKVLKITKYILCYQDQDKKVVTGHFSLANSGLHWLQNIICWWTVAVGMMSGCNVWNVLSNLVTTGPSSYFTGMRTVL